MKAKADTPFVPLNIAVLTVSDTRTRETDTSGQMFVDRLTDAGHGLIERVLLKDDLYKIRAQVATWIADDQVQVVLITGGTGFTGRDSTPEAVACLLDKQVDGFGELVPARYPCRTSAPLPFSPARWPVCLMARWSACLPGSTNAVRLPHGTGFSPSSWIRASGPATLCRTSSRPSPARPAVEC
ncbi:molybdenum cofactor biosynthesis protein [Pseudomonas syringae pv. actinidifoliorum]|nr:molybdenum cofactor biosynthesis protein [Pseudomonas syringae pv. actinidifoliorum]